MLSRLLNLYSKSNSNTPLEDFTTEAFAGILEQDPETLHAFTREVLKIGHNSFRVETQKHYLLSDGSHAIIDIVLRNENAICFIENKVESGEGNNQLDKYSRILDSLTEYAEKYLFYCTKYFDPKEETRHRFRQFRWFEIANVLKNSENQLVKELYTFLNKNNMARKDELTTKDLFYLENFQETMGFLDSFLDRIRPSFEGMFGKASNKDNVIEMRKHKRFVFVRYNVFGSGTSEIGVGFKFTPVPSAYVWIWTVPSHSKATRFNEYLTVPELRAWFDECGKELCLFRADLVSFLGKENSMEELENWYQERFKIIKNFIDRTPELEWKI